MLFAGRYRIERLLGVGGMGAVYKAEDQELGIPIALKVIRTEVLSNPGVGIDFERRFKQELLLARQVTHQNVLRIHDLGESNGVKYITMPFIEGSDLHAILGSGHLPFERVLSLARQITSGLAAAHDVGIVHRDLKPQNILVDLSGRAYISDFGLAKSYEASAAGLTRPGDFIGTPRYMAPESVEGQPSDHRSDLYALGLILYEMASGSTPFPGDSALEVLMQRVRISPRPLKEVAPDLPPFFTNIVMRCLEKEPARRYQTARDLLQDLEQSKAPAGTRSRRSHQSVVINLPLPTSRGGWIDCGPDHARAGRRPGRASSRASSVQSNGGSSSTLPSPSERKLDRGAAVPGRGCAEPRSHRDRRGRGDVGEAVRPESGHRRADERDRRRRSQAAAREAGARARLEPARDRHGSGQRLADQHHHQARGSDCAAHDLDEAVSRAASTIC